MPEACHSMLLSNLRQTSPSVASTPLPQLSVSPSDLDLRQVPRTAEGRGHELESCSDLGPGRPWAAETPSAPAVRYRFGACGRYWQVKQLTMASPARGCWCGCETRPVLAKA